MGFLKIKIPERFLVHSTPGHTVRQTNQSWPHSRMLKRMSSIGPLWRKAEYRESVLYALEGHCASQPVPAWAAHRFLTHSSYSPPLLWSKLSTLKLGRSWTRGPVGRHLTFGKFWFPGQKTLAERPGTAGPFWGRNGRVLGKNRVASARSFMFFVMVQSSSSRAELAFQGSTTWSFLS